MSSTECKMLIDFRNIDIQSLSSTYEFGKKVISFLKEFLLQETQTVKVQTSGSTGTPKIFEVEKQKMLNSAKMTCDFLHLKEGNSALLCLPVEYISGKMMIVRSLERKLKLNIEEPSVQPLKDLQEEIDFCAMTPLQVENSLDKIHLIKKLIIGGAAVSETLKKKIFKQLKAENQSQITIFETYGMSETLSHIALKEIYPKSDEFFRVFEGIQIGNDERNCLKIDAPMLSAGILQTNDLVEIKNENQFRFLGRIDNIINSGGAKIFPEQLEALVKKIVPAELVFVGIPDEQLGQKLVLIIEKSHLMDHEQVCSQVSDIAFQQKFHKPKEIIFVERIPRTPNGKVNRLELLEKIKAVK